VSAICVVALIGAGFLWGSFCMFCIMRGFTLDDAERYQTWRTLWLRGADGEVGQALIDAKTPGEVDQVLDAAMERAR
jgi:hypothetical protein